MTKHPSEAELDDYAGGAAEGGAARDEVEAHVAACAPCRARVERVVDFRARLAALPAAAEPARDLWPELAARLAATAPSTATDLVDDVDDGRDVIPLEPRLRRRAVGSVWLQRAAAAAILFVGGVALGRGTAPSPGTPASPVAQGPAASAPATPLAAAEEIQRAGTAYVTAVATFAALYGNVSGTEVEQGRDAALATMAGAARELARLPSGDSTAVQVYRMVSGARGAQEAAPPQHAEPRTVRF